MQGRIEKLEGVVGYGEVPRLSKCNSNERVIMLIDHTNFRHLVRSQFLQIDYIKMRNLLLNGRIEIDTRLYYSELDSTTMNEVELEKRRSRERFYHRLKVMGCTLIELTRVQRSGYSVEKCLDAEIVADMLEISRCPRIDTIILVAGDGDYHRAVRRVRQQAFIRIEVAFFRHNTSTDLIREASKFTDLQQCLEQIQRSQDDEE